jgi:hypothetical protein
MFDRHPGWSCSLEYSDYLVKWWSRSGISRLCIQSLLHRTFIAALRIRCNAGSQQTHQNLLWHTWRDLPDTPRKVSVETGNIIIPSTSEHASLLRSHNQCKQENDCPATALAGFQLGVGAISVAMSLLVECEIQPPKLSIISSNQEPS